MQNRLNNKLTVFSLIMITVVSVDSVRNLPAAALFGSQLVFFYLMSALLFLIPCALISAELSSAWPEQGGIYIWIKKAFGPQLGLLAIWLQWIENVIWYPTILSFVAGSIGYLINPELATNKIFLIIIVLSSFWGCTFVNLKGITTSAKFSTFCTIAGLLLPMGLIIGLGAAWFFSNKPTEISLTLTNMIPNTQDSSTWVALTGIMLSFCGVEIATVHARDVNNPQRAFPKALIFSAIIILVTLIFGSLSLALVVPSQKISLVSGIMQAFDTFVRPYNLSWLLPFLSLTLVIGGLGSVSNWIIAPTKGLLVAAQDGLLPPSLQKENKNAAPSNLLIYQAIIVTCLTMVFLIFSSVNASYWLLTVLAAQLYMFMYILMFTAAIYLRIKYPNQPRPFKVPGGLFGLSVISIAGIIGSTITFIVGYIPPSTIEIGKIRTFEFLLISGFIVMCLPPFISYYFRSRKLALPITQPT
jgi:amino acid transporter